MPAERKPDRPQAQSAPDRTQGPPAGATTGLDDWRGATRRGPGQAAPIRVVVVDDEEHVRRLVRVCLQLEHDFAVVGEAGDGTEAVSVVAATSPDVVVLDLEMPHMSGLAAIPELRRSAPSARIAVLSAYPDPYTLGEALTMGADTYLDKAMELADLAPALRALLDVDEHADP
jgi:DNA-binding NarL/FixJ family response regulator